MAGLVPLLSGLIFWTLCRALILLCSERFATFWTRKEINAMRHHNTVLHQLLKLIPWAEFDRLVDEHKADKHMRTLSTKSQLIAMTFAQLSGAASLREIEGGLQSHASCLYHLGTGGAKRSTLADANRLRSAEVFCTLFAILLKQLTRGQRRKLADATYLIDATSLQLTKRAESWARYSTNVCSAKAHVIYDPNADRPIYFSISAGNVNDINAAQQMPIQAGATYVFDLGYYDFRWWASLDDGDCRIVTRLKKNTPLRVIEEMVLPKDSPILSDRIGFLPERQSYTRKNPMQNAVRELRVKTDTGKVLRILTNDLDATAQEIADLYKSRWLIELFFRWIKQNLRIRHLLGTTLNAVRIQVATAMIAFLLLRLAQSFQSAIQSPLAFARLVRANIMHRRRINRLLEHDPLDPPNPHQMVLQWT
jgi:hypothetical protein